MTESNLNDPEKRAALDAPHNRAHNQKRDQTPGQTHDRAHDQTRDQTHDRPHGAAHDETQARKSELRKALRATLAAMTADDRHAKSQSACSFIASTPEFKAARVIMLYLTLPIEVDTAPLALRAWQAGKTVVVPKVTWEQRRMLAIEITSLTTGLTTARHGVREPLGGAPMPVSMIDLVVVPGLGFSANGYRIGRGMGFYDRFLAQSDFLGGSCGIGFEEQLVTSLPVLDHDMPLGMLATDRGIRRFASCSLVRR